MIGWLKKVFGPPDPDELKADKNVSGLISALHYSDPSVRSRSIKALAEVDPEKALTSLNPLLEDASEQVRRAALEALADAGELGTNRLIATLADTRLRPLASEVLTTRGPSMVGAIIAALDHPRGFTWNDAAAEVLIAIGRQGQPHWRAVVNQLVDRIERGPRNTPMVYAFRALKGLVFANPPDGGVYTADDIDSVVDLAKAALGRGEM